MNKGIVKAHLALLIANIIYALNYDWAKDVMEGEHIQPFAFILLRVTGASILFWSLAFIFYEKVAKKDLIKMLFCGLFGVAANQLMFFQGLDLTSRIHASIIMVSSPVLVALLSMFILNEKFTITRFLGISLGIGGATYLIIQKNSSASGASFNGDIFVFMNAASYGLYLVLVKSLMKKYAPLTVIRWVFTFGLLFVIPFGFSQLNSIDFNMPDDIILKIGLVIVFTTFFCYLLNIYGIKRVSPTVVSSYIYLQPILTAFFAIMAKDESLDISMIISSIAIFLGVYLVSIPSLRTT